MSTSDNHAPVDALVSYHYYKRDEDMHAALSSGWLRLIGDSGAFSAFSQGADVKLDEFAAWCRRWRDHLYWIAALDVLGDPDATLANFRKLRDTYQLATVPTIHIGADPRWLDVYAREGVDFVGLGGMVGLGTRVMRWLVHVLRYARDHHPEMRFHAWGVTSPTILNKVPLYSADSSGLLGSVFRYAEIPLYDERTRRHERFKLNGRDPYKHRRLLSDYGTTPEALATSHTGSSALIGRVSLQSAQRYGRYLQQRHRVPAPTWGINTQAPNLPGTRIHVVTASPLGMEKSAWAYASAIEGTA